MIERLRQILRQAIQRTPFEQVTYFAGGSVRDYILGRNTTDFDLAVELDEGGIRLAEYLYETGVSSKPVVYKQFGTALVYIDGHKTELVMTRKESYRSHSRHPSVQYATLKEDVSRRDFTINSLLMRVTNGEILDLTGLGRADLQDRIIRATSNPELIFDEDPLRMLRAIRFATTLDCTIETETYSCIQARVAELQHISMNRTGEEYALIMACDGWYEGMILLENVGLLPYIIPEAQADSWEYAERLSMLSEEQADLLPELSLGARYWYLLSDAEYTDSLLNRLQRPAMERKQIKEFGLAMEQMYLLSYTACLAESTLNRFVYNFSKLLPEVMAQFLLLKSIDIPYRFEPYSPEVLVEIVQSRAADLATKRFCLTGQDFLRSFCLKSSPLVGELLSEAMEYWFCHPEVTKTDLLNHVQALHPELVSNIR